MFIPSFASEKDLNFSIKVQIKGSPQTLLSNG